MHRFPEQVSQMPWTILGFALLWLVLALSVVFKARGWANLAGSYWVFRSLVWCYRVIGSFIVVGSLIALVAVLSSQEGMVSDPPILVFIIPTSIGAVFVVFADAIVANNLAFAESDVGVILTRLVGMIHSFVAGAILIYGLQPYWQYWVTSLQRLVAF